MACFARKSVIATKIGHYLNRMLLFAHTGIAVAAVFAVDRLRYVLPSKTHSVVKDSRPVSSGDGAHGARSIVDVRSNPWATFLKAVDYRFVIIGSMLPDIIDKPLGQLILRNQLSNGRIFSHTLLFLLIVIAAGLLVQHFYKKPYVLYLAAGTFIHLVLDGIWLTPCTLFWPACGLAFPKYDLENWTLTLLKNLFSDPATFIPEAFGAAIVIYLSVRTLVKKSVRTFFTTGNLSFW